MKNLLLKTTEKPYSLEVKERIHLLLKALSPALKNNFIDESSVPKNGVTKSPLHYLFCISKKRHFSKKAPLPHDYIS